MNRRSFLGSILALGLAPAVVKASSIMRVRALPEGWTIVDGGSEIAIGESLLTGELGRYEGVRFIEPQAEIFVRDYMRALFSSPLWDGVGRRVWLANSEFVER